MSTNSVTEMLERGMPTEPAATVPSLLSLAQQALRWEALASTVKEAQSAATPTTWLGRLEVQIHNAIAAHPGATTWYFYIWNRTGGDYTDDKWDIRPANGHDYHTDPELIAAYKEVGRRITPSFGCRVRHADGFVDKGQPIDAVDGIEVWSVPLLTESGAYPRQFRFNWREGATCAIEIVD